MAKGGQFERDICRELSMWWTDGERDDVFWRTSQSGGRATTRRKKGKKTFGQYGDVQATDPIGQPLIDLCTIELKKGYNKASCGDLLDKNLRFEGKPTPWEKMVHQAIGQAKEAQTSYWWLIHKRDHRETILYFPGRFFGEVGLLLSSIRPVVVLETRNNYRVVGMSLTRFLQATPPKFFQPLKKIRLMKKL